MEQFVDTVYTEYAHGLSLSDIYLRAITYGFPHKVYYICVYKNVKFRIKMVQGDIPIQEYINGKR